MPGPIRARVRFAIASLTLGLALSACGDDDPTGPVDVDIVGVWVMDVTGTDSTGTCQVSDITLGFVRVNGNGEPDPNGSVVEGGYEFGGAGTIVCMPGGPGDASGAGLLEDIVETAMTCSSLSRAPKVNGSCPAPSPAMETPCRVR